MVSAIGTRRATVLARKPNYLRRVSRPKPKGGGTPLFDFSNPHAEACSPVANVPTAEHAATGVTFFPRWCLSPQCCATQEGFAVPIEICHRFGPHPSSIPR